MTVKTTDFTLGYLFKDFLPGELPVSHRVNEVGYCALLLIFVVEGKHYRISFTAINTRMLKLISPQL
ncbi:MAG: hypothetical protein ACLGJB_03850 [Blastocatellia bacterium]